jgi:hypothetical protein
LPVLVTKQRVCCSSLQIKTYKRRASHPLLGIPAKPRPRQSTLRLQQATPAIHDSPAQGRSLSTKDVL